MGSPEVGCRIALTHQLLSFHMLRKGIGNHDDDIEDMQQAWERDVQFLHVLL